MDSTVQGPQGPQGEQGPKGDTGETGATGATGPASPGWLWGEGAPNSMIPGTSFPANTEYHQTFTGDVYSLDPASGWVGPIANLKGAAGAAGSNGSNGADGSPGMPGADGDKGLARTAYLSSGDPNGTEFKLNSSNFSGVTSIIFGNMGVEFDPLGQMQIGTVIIFTSAAGESVFYKVSQVTSGSGAPVTIAVTYLGKTSGMPTEFEAVRYSITWMQSAVFDGSFAEPLDPPTLTGDYATDVAALQDFLAVKITGIVNMLLNSAKNNGFVAASGA